MHDVLQAILDHFDRPIWLWLLLLIVPVLLLGRWSMATMDPLRRWVSLSLRVAVVVVLVLMLAGLQSVQRHAALSVMAVVDQSESVRRFGTPPPGTPGSGQPATTDAANSSASASGGGGGGGIAQWIQNYLEAAAAKDKRQDDMAGEIEYDGKARVRSPIREAYTFDSGVIEQRVDGTDSAGALRLAMSQFPPDTGKRILWVGDGNETTSGAGYDSHGGDLLEVAREAKAAGIAIDVLPVTYAVKHEVMVEALYAPSLAREGQTAALRVVLRATDPTTGKLFLKHDDQIVQAGDGELGWPIRETDWTQELDNSEQARASGRWVTVKQIDLPLTAAGAHSFEAVFEADHDSDDTMAVNNKAQAFTLVGGRGRVLVVNNVPGASGEILPKALRSRGIELDVIPPSGFPVSQAQLQRYDSVIFQNVPADQISPAQQKMLARYVNDLGGGFVMVGGPDSFGAGAWANSPVDKILPVSCTIPTQKVLPSGALVVVIDRSGSMGSTVGGTNKSQQEIANEAALLALSSLYPQDLVGVIAFDNSAKTIVKLQLNTDFRTVADKVRSIAPGGGTNIYSGLEAAYEDLAKVTTDEAAIKHVILLTDGQSQNAFYARLVGNMRKAGITVSTIGVGDGHDATLLGQIANMGGGKYHPVVNPNLLPQIFVKEAKTIRKNLIKEKTFQPELVNTGSPIMANITAVPRLRGLVLTGPKQDVRVMTPIVGPEGEPVFAHWQVGLGRAAAFTSDATNRWAVDWLNWDGYADFWARTIRAISRPPASRNIDLVTSLQGDVLHLRLDAAGGEFGQAGGRRTADFANFLTVRGAVILPDGQTRDVTLEQTGPGMYQADVPAAQAGNYIAELFITSDNGETQRVTGGASKVPGAELRRFETNMNLLRQVANITGGRLLDPAAPQPAGLFERTSEFESTSVRPLWRSLMWLLFVLFLLDVASRRVAWDLSAGWERTRLTASDIFGAMRPGKARTAATLSALKTRREAAARQYAAKDGSMRFAAPKEPAAKPDRLRKFEAAPEFVATDDLAAAVGAASHNDETSDAARRRKIVRPDKSDKPQGPTTSRLLAAKQRAKEQMRGEQENDQ